MWRRRRYGRKRFSRRGTYKRRYSRRSFGRARRSFKSSPVGDRTNSRIVHFRYCTADAITYPTSGIIEKRNYRCNSIWDPDQTRVGHKASPYDDWYLKYNHYTVLASTIKVEILGADIAAAEPTQVMVFLNDDLSTIPTTWNALLESGRRVASRTFGGGVDKVKPIIMSYYPKSFHGVKDVADNTDHLGATMTTNPAEEAYFTILVGSYDQGVRTSTIHTRVTIDYKVLLSEPSDPLTQN